MGSCDKTKPSWSSGTCLSDMVVRGYTVTTTPRGYCNVWPPCYEPLLVVGTTYKEAFFLKRNYSLVVPWLCMYLAYEIKLCTYLGMYGLGLIGEPSN